MKRHILFLAGLLTILSLSACSSFESEETETSDEAYICIGIDGVSTARTIAPTFNVAELRQFSLSGRKNAEDDWTSFAWYNKTENIFCIPLDTYQDLLNSTVAIKTGTWYEFKLTACINNKDYGSTYFVGTISNKEIVKGKNTLNFTLMPDAERNNNSGYVNVTFKIPSATAVKKAEAGLYKLDSDELYGYSTPQTLSITPSEDSDTATAVYSYGGSISKGSYRLKAWFYADEECTVLVSTFCELVKVLDGITTNAGRDIDMLNTVYTITLNEGSYKEDFTPKTLYTRFEGVKLPKSEEMYKPGYTFMGWYTNAEGSGEPITEIPSTQAENVVLYAKWLEGYWLTADTWEIYVQRGFDGLEEISIHLVGEWTNENFSKFVHWSSELWDENKSISLDMSQSTGITEIKNNVFFYTSTSSHYCLGLVSVKLPASVTSIGDEAFKGCSSLKSIELPESLTSIGKSAFENCKSLENIDLPESLTSIGKDAFSGCSSLKNIDLPENLTSIGDSAFESCTSLQSIKLPETLTTIGICAFRYCTSLKNVVIPSKVIVIPAGLFSGCAILESVVFKGNVTSIGAGAFYGCTFLKTLEVPDTVTELGKEAFYGVISVSIGPNLSTKYLSKSYEGNLDEPVKLWGGIKNLILREGVTTLGLFSFAKCDDLETISLSASIIKIDWPFYWTKSDLKIFFADAPSEWEYYFWRTPGQIKKITTKTDGNNWIFNRNEQNYFTKITQ